MKKTMYGIIIDHYKQKQTGMTSSWILDTLIERGFVKVSISEIEDILKQLERESKITWMPGDFYKPY